MPALDDLDAARRERVLEVKTKVRDVVRATQHAEPEVAEAIRWLGVQVLSLTARAEYAEQRLDACTDLLRALGNGPS